MKKKALHRSFAPLLCGLIPLCASCILSVSCSGDSDTTDYEAAQEEEAVAPSPYRLTVEATKAIDDATRALALADNTLNAAWAEDDEVTVYDKYMRPLGTLAPVTAGSATAKLQGTLTEIPEQGAKLTLLFPRPAWDYTGQNGTLASIATLNDYANAEVTVSSANQTGMTTTDANFTNQQAIVKFILVDKDNSDAPLNAEQLTIGTEGGKLVQKYVQTVEPSVNTQYDANGSFVIKTADDWKTFCNMVNKGQNGLNAILDADVDISAEKYKLDKVGYWNRIHYKGTFDGNGHTLTVAYSDDRYSNTCAPFVEVGDGCTIKNLHVAGTIATAGTRPAGIVGRVNDGAAVTVQNCLVSADITCTSSWGSYSGGIVSTNSAETNALNIADCAFTGSITTQSSDSKVGGILGWAANGTTTTLTRVLFAPTSLNVPTTYDYYTHTFCCFAAGGSSTRTYSDCYYTQLLKQRDDKTEDAENAALKDASEMTASQIATALGSGWTVTGSKATPKLTQATITYPEESYVKGQTAPQYGSINVKPVVGTTNEFFVALRNEAGGADTYTLTALLPNTVTIAGTDYNAGYERSFTKSGITFEHGKFYIITVKMSHKGYDTSTYTTEGRNNYNGQTSQTWE